jgi:DNA polymerase-3 subunit epsilon
MRDLLRFLGALLVGALLMGGSLALGLFLLLQGEEALKEALLQVARAKAPLLLLLLFLFLGVLALLLRPLFLGYLAAARALGQEGAVLLTNPGHRLKLRGPLELQALADLINRLAEEKERLLQEAEARAKEARALLEEEREKLSALIGHLPQGVVVANARGQVLLYNPKARALLGEGLGAGKKPLWPIGPGPSGPRPGPARGALPGAGAQGGLEAPGPAPGGGVFASPGT